MTATSTYARKDIESTKAMDRPKVRCRYDADYRNEDNQLVRSEIKATTGRIVVDGNNPWLEIWAGGRWVAERFSWALVLEILNDPWAQPIHFGQRVEYEV